MGMTICYCFGYTDADIRADVIANKGESTILYRIRTEKQQGGCRCHEVNPGGK